ncbi:hypothetical protein [Candidatus Allofournierella merdipullorum]|uniref:hypothetical protein n=1 Tax=Candidatus Allofournierella merdipullorum TaxID=2838595 RepID=UPI00374FD490
MFEVLEDLDNVLESAPPAVVDLQSSPEPVLSDETDSEDVAALAPGTDLNLDGSYIEYEPALMSVDGVYNADIHSAARDYFEGVISQNPGVPYVSFRDGRYTSVMFYGDGISYSGGRFSGTSDYIRYDNEYNTTNVITRGTDSVSIGNIGYIYSNLDNSFAAFPAGEVSNHASVLSLGLCVCIGLWIVGRIFFRSR